MELSPTWWVTEAGEGLCKKTHLWHRVVSIHCLGEPPKGKGTEHVKGSVVDKAINGQVVLACANEEGWGGVVQAVGIVEGTGSWGLHEWFLGVAIMGAVGPRGRGTRKGS